MSRFTVWSPHDGRPVPARNAREREALIGRGYLAAPPLVGEHGPELIVREEAGHVVEAAGATSGDLSADGKRRRIRGRQETVADELGDDAEPDGEVPSPAK